MDPEGSINGSVECAEALEELIITRRRSIIGSEELSDRPIS
jgi:hypothetical protein